MIFRRANSNDLPGVLSLMREASNQVGFVPQPRLLVEIERGAVIVADHHGEICGYIMGGRREESPTVQMLAVRKVWRRKKVGTGLFNEWLRRRRLFVRVGLRCREELPANAFWRALGFIEAERLPGGAARKKEILRYER